MTETQKGWTRTLGETFEVAGTEFQDGGVELIVTDLSSWGGTPAQLPMPKLHIGGWHQTREGEDRPYRGSWYRVKRNGRQSKWLAYVLEQENQARIDEYLKDGK